MFKKLLILLIIVAIVRLGYRYITGKGIITKVNNAVTTATDVVENAENTVNTITETIENPEGLLDQAKDKVVDLVGGNSTED